eukprot:259650-Hanusia_phi.AAC.1
MSGRSETHDGIEAFEEREQRSKAVRAHDRGAAGAAEPRTFLPGVASELSQGEVDHVGAVGRGPGEEGDGGGRD